MTRRPRSGLRLQAQPSAIRLTRKPPEAVFCPFIINGHVSSWFAAGKPYSSFLIPLVKEVLRRSKVRLPLEKTNGDWMLSAPGSGCCDRVARKVGPT